ncbi:MAG TPA: DUF190 domain-containing protein [Candidatus Tumulicola sp.]
MNVRQRVTLMRIYLSEDVRHGKDLLYVAIVEELRSQGFAGATVLRGIEGYGGSGEIRSSRARDTPKRLPVVIEVIDSDHKVRSAIPTLRAMMSSGLITTERVRIKVLTLNPGFENQHDLAARGRREPDATVFELFHELARHDRKLINDAVGSAHAGSDIAACLLGLNLWRGPLARYRDHLLVTRERPPLWAFTLGPSAEWNAALWLTLPMVARLVRTRVGRVDESIRTRPTVDSTGLTAALLRDGLRHLSQSAYLRKGPEDIHDFAPIALPSAIATDLALVDVIAHWLLRLSDRHHLLAKSSAEQFEIGGYKGGCGSCRTRWGSQTRDEQAVPPFHPGCRCFASAKR